MTISALVMRSPSRVTRMRKTPWVLGCCGPMLITRGSVLSWPTSPLRAELAARLAGDLLWEMLEAWLEAAGQGEEVLAQGMPWIPLPEQQPLQVRMTAEADAHEVIHLSLLEVGTVPQGDHRGHFGVLMVRGARFQDQQVIPVQRRQVVHHLEMVQLVDAGDGDEVGAVQLRVGLQKAGHLQEVQCLHRHPLGRLLDR